MRFSSLVPAIALTAVPAVVTAQGASRVIDEGAFIITKPGSPPQTESFRISRGENGLIVATGRLSAGTHRVSSSLTADTLGTPVDYDLTVNDNRVQTMRVRATARSGRLSTMSSDQHGNESIKEYPISVGACLILEDELLHQTYFVALSRRSGNVEVISPRTAHVTTLALTARGSESVQTAERTVTGTHYSFGSGPNRREFWVDGTGRLLRVEIPAKGIVGVRDEMPR
jgi:hypothetical protein